jgi:nitrogen fixation-related uncharacterized protein
MSILLLFSGVVGMIGFLWGVYSNGKYSDENKYTKLMAISDARWEALLERLHLNDKELKKLAYKKEFERDM